MMSERNYIKRRDVIKKVGAGIAIIGGFTTNSVATTAKRSVTNFDPYEYHEVSEFADTILNEPPSLGRNSNVPRQQKLFKQLNKTQKAAFIDVIRPSRLVSIKRQYHSKKSDIDQDIRSINELIEKDAATLEYFETTTSTIGIDPVKRWDWEIENSRVPQVENFGLNVDDFDIRAETKSETQTTTYRDFLGASAINDPGTAYYWECIATWEYDGNGVTDITEKKDQALWTSDNNTYLPGQSSTDVRSVGTAYEIDFKGVFRNKWGCTPIGCIRNKKFKPKMRFRIDGNGNGETLYKKDGTAL